ncbi:MAG: PKD domain-containing protein [Calditrichaeota bacterium]|nr:MAG: PKD domain-containing protein [Calditrichota bacterium]
MIIRTATRILFVAMLILGPNHTAVAQDWTDPAIDIGSGGAPDLAIDATNGDVHVVLNNNSVVYYEFDRDGNLIWSDTIPNTLGIQYGYNFGSAIDVDSEGNPHICYARHTGSDVYDVYYTRFNGSNWIFPTKISSQIKRGYHMRMAIDDNDEVHIIRSEQVLPDDITPSKATYIRVKDSQVNSTTTGLDFHRPDDHVDIATFGSNDVHLLLGYPNPNGRHVYYYRSDTNGDQLIGPQSIDAAHITNRAGSPNIFIDQSGILHIVYGTMVDSQNGGSPSVRYQRRQDGNLVRDQVVTANSELSLWDQGVSVGVGAVASNSTGDIVVVAYHTRSGGALRTRFSNDGGATWSGSTQIASSAGGFEGRDKAMIEAHGNRFYVVYQNFGTVKLRWFKALGDPPVANAGGPYQKPEGEPVTFDASGSTSGSGGFTEYAWDWQGDGTFDDLTENATFVKTFTDNFTATAKLRVTDIDNRTAESTFSLQIINVKPAVTISAASTADEGDAVQFEAVISDPGDDTHTVDWDFGDGQTGSNATTTHSFIDEGNYTVSATVTDDDGGQSEKTFAISINNVAPVGNIGGPYTAVKDKAITLKGSASDPGSSDNLSFEWDLNNDGIFERPGSQVSITYTALGTYPISMRVIDGDGGLDIVNGEVIVGTGAPIISDIPDQQIEEGGSFSPLALDEFVTDPDHEDYQISWSYSGNSQLIVSIINRVVMVNTPSSEYFGTEVIQFTAEDPTNQQATVDIRYTVLSVNDAPQISTIPNQTVREGEVFSQIVLDNFVEDPDHVDNILFWEITGNTELTVSVINRIVQVTTPGPNWFGSETLTFKVRDPLGAVDSQQVVYTVTSYNDAPLIGEIPQQIIVENGAFTPISLDQYVTDPDNSIDQLSWSSFGQQNLSVTIDFNHLATIAVVDSEFAGTELISFVASDPGNQRDTSVVAFTVNGINDPPIISGFTDKTIDEDGSVNYSMADLATMIIDPDHTYNQLQYSLLGANQLQVAFEDGKGLSIFGPANWFGQETVTLKVDDGSAFDTAGMTITVNSVPDTPQPFSLLSPNASFYNPPPAEISFIWSKTDDPDPGESVTFKFELANDNQLTDIIHENSTLRDTIYNFPASHFLENTHTPETYYWRVTVTSTDGTVLRSQSDASFTILWPTTAVEGFSEGTIPTEMALQQNYPNPFNPETIISFDLPKSGEANLVIYNALGIQIKTLASGILPPGRHNFTWDARNATGEKVASGVYIYRLQADGKTFTKKMILMQ